MPAISEEKSPLLLGRTAAQRKTDALFSAKSPIALDEVNQNAITVTPGSESKFMKSHCKMLSKKNQRKASFVVILKRTVELEQKSIHSRQLPRINSVIGADSAATEHGPFGIPGSQPGGVRALLQSWDAREVYLFLKDTAY